MTLDPNYCIGMILHYQSSTVCQKLKVFRVYQVGILDVDTCPDHLEKFRIDYFVRLCFHSPFLGPYVSSMWSLSGVKKQLIFVEHSVKPIVCPCLQLPTIMLTSLSSGRFKPLL